MKKFIQDILVKAEYCKMIFTSAASIKDFAGQGGYIFQTKKLSNEQAYELLSSKVKSPKDLRKEIGELPTRISSKTSQPGAVRELNHNHDFVKILNGHPHSIILVSTLKNDLKLKDIYDRLLSLKKDKDEEKTMSEIVFSLNVEESIMNIK